MMKFLKIARSVLVLGTVLAGTAQAAQVNVVCSMNPEWCRNAAAVYERLTNVKVSVVNKPTGESFAQLMAEKERPKVDVWFGGTSDPHFQAAELGLLDLYRSPLLGQLYPWAQDAAKASGYKTVGLYSEVLGIAYNTELLAKKKLPAPKCWKDLANPAYKGELQMANAQSSGTSYVAIATFVQVMGEDEAFKFMQAMHKNMNSYSRQGLGPIKAVAKGESAASISFLHNAAQEAEQKFPVAYVVQQRRARTSFRRTATRQTRMAHPKSKERSSSITTWPNMAPAQSVAG